MLVGFKIIWLYWVQKSLAAKIDIDSNRTAQKRMVEKLFPECFAKTDEINAAIFWMGFLQQMKFNNIFYFLFQQTSRKCSPVQTSRLFCFLILFFLGKKYFKNTNSLLYTSFCLKPTTYKEKKNRKNVKVK